MSKPTATIADLLGLDPQKDRKFTFEGNAFEYHAAGPEKAEALITNWAEGTRYASPLNLLDDAALRQQLAMTLSHRFRKVHGGKAEQIEIIERAKAALAA